MKRYFQAVFGIMRAYQKRFYRDKVALFFTFLFPLIFLFVFGTIFRGSSVSFNVAVINHSKTEFSKDFLKAATDDKTFKVKTEVKTMDDAKKRMSRGELDSVLELPANFGTPNATGVPAGTMNVYYQKGSEQSGKTVAAVMQSILDDINAKLGRPAAALKVAEKATDDAGLSQFDYTFSGLLGFSLMSMGIFGLANAMPSEKQKGAFRRLRAAPIKASQLILANAFHYLIVTLMSIGVMFIIGLTVFDFSMRGNWLNFVLFTVLSAMTMLGFGLAIGGWARNENQSAPLTNLVSFPLMFLSGSFFPRFLFPEWLQHVSAFLPLTPVVDGLRRIMTENASLIELAPQVGLLAAWLVVIYFATFRLFRWE